MYCEFIGTFGFWVPIVCHLKEVNYRGVFRNNQVCYLETRSDSSSRFYKWKIRRIIQNATSSRCKTLREIHTLVPLVPLVYRFLLKWEVMERRNLQINDILPIGFLLILWFMNINQWPYLLYKSNIKIFLTILKWI